MEVGGRGQQLLFGRLPHESGQRDQLGHELDDLLVETFRAEISASQSAEYLVHRRVRGQCTIEYAELPLEPRRYIVSTAARMNHSSEHIHTYDVDVIARFRQREKAVVL